MGANQLTETYGSEFQTVLNTYFSTLQTEAAFNNPEEYCRKVAIGNELSRCIVTQGARTFHDTNQVVRLRVIERQEGCAVVIATHTSMGTTPTDSYLLIREGEVWKVAAIADALGEFDEFNPDTPFSCQNASQWREQ
jgi:hypothetical protein